MYEENWMDLATAIVEKAIDDYAKALKNLKKIWIVCPKYVYVQGMPIFKQFTNKKRGRKYMSTKIDCERFFRSEYYKSFMINVQGEAIIEGIRKEQEWTHG